jgi:hypothetical protein
MASELERLRQENSDLRRSLSKMLLAVIVLVIAGTFTWLALLMN